MQTPVTILDTSVFLYDALTPKKLSRPARLAIEKAAQRGCLAICGISLWEVAMLEADNRVTLHQGVERFLEKSVSAREYQILPITPSIAAISGSSAWFKWDPADRIIAATAIDLKAKLVTSDERLREAKLVQTIW
jgi:PIN domain nuclease of toxin-antitoxin system